MIAKEDIRKHAMALGLNPVGFTHSLPFERLRGILEERESLGYLSGFEAGIIEERCCPHLHLDQVRSIIAAGLPYPLAKYPGSNGLSGVISCSAAVEDYHTVLASKLERLAEYISARVEGFRYSIMVDTGPLVDREVAFRAGVGWYGKNCSVITPTWGSGVFLGEMLVNIELEPDQPMDMDMGCGECNLCIQGCPTRALKGPYILDAGRCISYLTQVRGVIPREMRGYMGNGIYGCDRCQQCCPHNARFLQDMDSRLMLGIKELLDMDKREFVQRYKKSAMGWRGLNVLKRNAVIALGNIKRKEGLPLLQKALEHGSEMVRGHAAWAIGEIGGAEGRGMLEKALAKEQGPYVEEEIRDALGRIGTHGA